MTPWEAVCAKAIDRYGETPGAELEAEIQAAYERDPKHVQGVIDRTAALVHAGKINSGWAVLRSELRKGGGQRKQRVREITAETIAAREAQQLADLETAEAEADMRARTFVSANTCPDCHQVKLPWWTKCLTVACVNRRRTAV